MPEEAVAGEFSLADVWASVSDDVQLPDISVSSTLSEAAAIYVLTSPTEEQLDGLKALRPGAKD